MSSYPGYRTKLQRELAEQRRAAKPTFMPQPLGNDLVVLNAEQPASRRDVRGPYTVRPRDIVQSREMPELPNTRRGNAMQNLWRNRLTRKAQQRRAIIRLARKLSKMNSAANAFSTAAELISTIPGELVVTGGTPVPGTCGPTTAMLQPGAVIGGYAPTNDPAALNLVCGQYVHFGDYLSAGGATMTTWGSSTDFTVMQDVKVGPVGAEHAHHGAPYQHYKRTTGPVSAEFTPRRSVWLNAPSPLKWPWAAIPYRQDHPLQRESGNVSPTDAAEAEINTHDKWKSAPNPWASYRTSWGFQGRPGEPMTPTPRPHEREKPGPKVKERKVRMSGPIMRALRGAISGATETFDLIDAFHKALPKHLRCKPTLIGWKVNKKGVPYRVYRACTPSKKAALVYEHWDKIPMKDAIFNALWNQVEDGVYGRLSLGGSFYGTAVGQHFGKSGVGLETGAALDGQGPSSVHEGVDPENHPLVKALKSLEALAKRQWDAQVGD